MRLLAAVAIVLIGSALLVVPAAAAEDDPDAGAGVAAVPDALVGSLDWPVPRAPVLRAFAAPASRWGAGHRGIDVAAAPGAVVVAAASGVVSFAGVVVDRPVVTIRMEVEGHAVLVTVEPVEPFVAAGDVVAVGQPIGSLLAGHRPCGACVHLGVRIDDAYANPMALLGAERSVLLPVAEAGRADRQARGCAVRYDAVSRSSETCV